MTQSLADPLSPRQAQRLARLTGLFFLITYAASIPPVFSFYAPALSDPAFILGGGFDAGISWGALFEMVLIAANVGTALAMLPILKRQSEVLAQGFLAARLMESAFIAVGIVALLALNTLRASPSGADEVTRMAIGQALVATHDWTFRLGPGVVVGVGNGLILGFLLWKARLVPRGLSVLGLVGGPALLAAGVAVIFGVIDFASAPQVIATVPEFFWELGLGLWLMIRGVDPEALERLLNRPRP